MKASAVNLATFANALCHLNATPLSVAVLAPCAWGEILARGVAWQSVVNSATHNTAWRGEFGSEMAQRGKIQWHGKASAANSVWQAWRNGRCLQAKQSVATRQIQHGKMWRCLRAKRTKRKWGSVWAGDFSLFLSLVARTF